MTWQQIKDLKEKRAKAFSDASAIRESANKENRDLNADELKRHDALLVEVEGFNTRIQREERAAQVGEAVEQHQANHIRQQLDGENPSGLPTSMLKRFSIHRAIRGMIPGARLDGVEGEINQEIAKRLGKPAQGFYLPTDLPMGSRRTLNIGTSGVGALQVVTEPTFIDVLRAKLVVSKLKATILTGLQGRIAIPQKTAASTMYWLAEAGAPTASNATLAQVLFTPKTAGAYTDITRQFVEQNSLDAEAFTLDDLTRTIAVGIDTAVFQGASSNQPTGIINISGVGSRTVAADSGNGGAPVYGDFVGMESTVAEANADIGDMSYVTTPQCRGLLKVTARSTSAVGVGFVWQDDNTVNGYPAYATNVIPSNGTKGSGSNLSTAVFGNFNDLVIAQWGALDITVDPYTGSSAGTLRLVALQDLDIEVRHVASFCIMTDIIAAA